jgi:hypothetical protein
MIDGKQCTVLWHVDNLKISHVNPDVITSILEHIEAEFGKESTITITRGRIHDYRGMKLNYSEKDKVKPKCLIRLRRCLQTSLPPNGRRDS